MCCRHGIPCLASCHVLHCSPLSSHPAVNYKRKWFVCFRVSVSKMCLLLFLLAVFVKIAAVVCCVALGTYGNTTTPQTMTTRSVEEEYGNNSCNKDEVRCCSSAHPYLTVA